MMTPSLEQITIRNSTIDDAFDVANIHVKGWQQSYKDIISNDYLNNLSLEKRFAKRKEILKSNNSVQINLVAEFNNKIIGFCDAGPCQKPNPHFKGEIHAIYLLDGFKNLGIGKELFNKARKYLEKNELIPFVVWSLQENKIARSFYEKNGGIVLQENLVEIGGKEYGEVAYIFKNS